MRRSQLTEEECPAGAISFLLRRDLPLAQAGVQVRAGVDGGSAGFVGHAAVFDTRTAIGNPLTWGFYEEIAPGAFTKTLSEGDARMLIDHDSYYVVARSSANTLRLSQDRAGLAVDADLDTNLSYVNDLVANLRNGNISGMSFGFYVVKDAWTTEEVSTSDGQTAEIEVRRILETKLVEVSAVTFPAYEETDAGLRAALRHRGDVDAVARRMVHRPELADLLAELTPATDTSHTEPGETTRDGDAVSDEVTEPAASTRIAPSQHELAKARLRAIQARMHRPAA